MPERKVNFMVIGTPWARHNSILYGYDRELLVF